jgi:hypothetical protein
MFFPLIEELNQDYWCTHTGVDGYMYLLFQRRFLKLTYYMTAISFFAQFLLYLIEKDFEFSLFGDKKLQNENGEIELSFEKSWVSITIIFLFTIITIHIV